MDTNTLKKEIKEIEIEIKKIKDEEKQKIKQIENEYKNKISSLELKKKNLELIASRSIQIINKFI